MQSWSPYSLPRRYITSFTTNPCLFMPTHKKSLKATVNSLTLQKNCYRANVFSSAAIFHCLWSAKIWSYMMNEYSVWCHWNVFHCCWVSSLCVIIFLPLVLYLSISLCWTVWLAEIQSHAHLISPITYPPPDGNLNSPWESCLKVYNQQDKVQAEQANALVIFSLPCGNLNYDEKNGCFPRKAPLLGT